jgi:hypothetical protein
MSRIFLHHVALVLALLAVGRLPAQPPPDGSWEANAILEKPTTRTVEA